MGQRCAAGRAQRWAHPDSFAGAGAAGGGHARERGGVVGRSGVAAGMKRRTLLSLLLAGSVGVALARPRAARSSVLVLLELRGGNDGLNTVAPVLDPLCQQARPTLALRDGLLLAEGLTLHPALAPLLPKWKIQRLAFVLGVGWPRPNCSHFKAADQWATGFASVEGPGWLTRALPQGPLLALGPGACAAMEVALQLAPAQLRQRPLQALDPNLAGNNPVLRQLLELEQSGQLEIERLRRELAPLPPGLEIPRGGLGQQVALALRLIGSGHCSPALQQAQGGYDTHVQQAGRHGRVLAELCPALAAFAAGLERLAVRLLAVSEFCRRLQENGSLGTDHGSASVALLLGDGLREPLIGRYPSLRELDGRGDLIPGISPPDLYRQVVLQGCGRAKI